MMLSKEKQELRDQIFSYDKQIEKLHLDFQKYHAGELEVMPQYEALERELLAFSRKKIFDRELNNHLDRVLYKFQNRKKIWLKWIEEVHGSA